jgi:thiopeptide-type bacteriocin biosynthesis protein
VCLTFGDNRLILNLDLADHTRILLAEWKRLLDNQSLLLQEVVPSLDEAWLRGDEGRYYSEFTVPLLLQEAATIQKSTSKPRPATTPVWESRRQFQPGSEWLFIKLYGSPDRQDELITQSLLPFARNASAAGLIDSWFFIRYADPEEHLRLRFHGNPEQLCEQFFGQLCRWASDLVERGLCRRFAFDFYDSELERFGGPEGVSLSEEIFHADSEASSELTTVLAARDWQDPEQRTILLVLSVHDLIGGFGLDASDALDWYKRHSMDSKEPGEEYRRLKNQLRVALTDPSTWLATRPLGDQIKGTLLLRRRQLSPLLVQLQDLESSSTLQRAIDDLCASYVHLHLNRLGAAASEGKILNFLRRTCESLSKAPVKL